MRAEECLRSSNGLYVLKMQSDGNLVLYQNSNYRACWASSWENGGRYFLGDQAYVSVLRPTPNYAETTLGTRNPNSSTWHLLVTYSDVAPPGTERTYNVSVNGSGQLWIGWDFYRSC